MLRIGLTGGIASGKSAAAEQFAELGAQVIDTDVIARQVVAPGTPGLQQLAAEFGTEILTPEGTLDRAALRARVFNDATARRQLEALLHPLIRAATLAEAATASGPYQVFVVPLLVETDFGKLVDRVLVIDCPEALQRQRLRQRDQTDPAATEQMLAAQTDRASRLAAADDIIVNDGSRAELASAVRKLHEKYLRLAADIH